MFDDAHSNAGSSQYVKTSGPTCCAVSGFCKASFSFTVRANTFSRARPLTRCAYCLFEQRPDSTLTSEGGAQILLALLELARPNNPNTPLLGTPKPQPSPVLFPPTPAASPSLPSEAYSAPAQAELPTQLALAVLDTLLCGLVDHPKNMRTFESVGGLGAIVRVLKDKSVSQAVRCVEVVLLTSCLKRSPRSHRHCTAPAGSRSSRCSSFTSCRKRLLPRRPPPISTRSQHRTQRLRPSTRTSWPTLSSFPTSSPAQPTLFPKRPSNRAFVHHRPLPLARDERVPLSRRARVLPPAPLDCQSAPILVRVTGCRRQPHRVATMLDITATLWNVAELLAHREDDGRQPSDRRSHRTLLRRRLK